MPDRQGNLRDGGGRQVLMLAGQLRDQLLEPGIDSPSPTACT